MLISSLQSCCLFHNIYHILIFKKKKKGLLKRFLITLEDSAVRCLLLSLSWGPIGLLRFKGAGPDLQQQFLSLLLCEVFASSGESRQAAYWVSRAVTC